jgi:hypothetical protein
MNEIVTRNPCYVRFCMPRRPHPKSDRNPNGGEHDAPLVNHAVMGQLYEWLVQPRESRLSNRDSDDATALKVC